jgi:hypothetical protein
MIPLWKAWPNGIKRQPLPYLIDIGSKIRLVINLILREHCSGNYSPYSVFFLVGKWFRFDLKRAHSFQDES